MSDDLILGRMAVGAGHLSKDELTWAVQTAQDAGKSLSSVMLEEGYLTQSKLQLLLGSLGQGAQPAGNTQSLYCALCDENIKVLDFVANSAYNCQKCGGTLDAIEDMSADEIPSFQNIESAVPANDFPAPSAPPHTEPPPEPDTGTDNVTTAEYLELVTSGNRLVQGGHLLEAKAKTDQAIQMLPDDSPARLLRSWICLEIDLPQQTVEDTTRLISAGQDLAQALVLRAHARVRNKVYSTAIEDLDRAMSHGASGPLVHVLRGTCYYKMHKLAQARQEYLRGCELAGEQPPRPEEKLLIECMTQAESFILKGNRPDTIRIVKSEVEEAFQAKQEQQAQPEQAAAPPEEAAAPPEEAAAPPEEAAAPPEEAAPPPEEAAAPPEEAAPPPEEAAPPPEEQPTAELELTRVVRSPGAPTQPSTTRAPTTCHCSGPLQSGWLYCPMCARPIGGRCPKCNEALLPQWQRCPYC